jgi:hypothetical protein
MLSLRQSLAGIGEPKTVPFSLRESFNKRTPSSLKTTMLGMTNPQVNDWQFIGENGKIEDSKYSEEAQGCTNDGTYWYLCSNHTKSVLRWSDKLEIIPSGDVPRFSPDCHYGAPRYYDGWIYVPLQDPRGIWKFATDLSSQYWVAATELPDGDLFAWCAVYPVNGLLYTCNFTNPSHLRAYDRDSLARYPNDDIPLGYNINHIQGGLFTPFGRVILVSGDSDEYNNIFCFSAFNGHCFGAKALGDYGSTSSEVESVTYAPSSVGGQLASIHVMELDNDADCDDVYLWAYSVPNPDLL